MTTTVRPVPERAPQPAAMVPVPMRVTERRRETADMWTLTLAPPGGHPFRIRPGQFTMLSAGGSGEVAISVSGDPGDPSVLVHTVRAVGAATEAICAAVPGRVLGVRGPFGRGWPTPAPGFDVVLVAGGCGFAPLRAALLALLRRDDLGRILVLAGARSPRELLFADELAGWAGGGADVRVTVDHGGPGWRGEVGLVTELVARARLDPDRTVAMVCGPELMMRLTAAALHERGLGPERVYVSLERNMQCGVGRCGHCQLGPFLLCRDGPVLRLDAAAPWLQVPEL